MSYQLQLGTYQFPTTLYIADDSGNRAVPAAKLPRADGAVIPTGYLDKRVFTLQGGLFRPLGNTTANYLRTQVDALKAGLAQGPASFYRETDRYWRNCQAEEYSESYEATGAGRINAVRFTLVTGDPWGYSTTTTTVTQAVSGASTTFSVTPLGNAYAKPQWQITSSVTGTLTFSLTNTTTGEIATFSLSVTSGNVIIIDSLNEAVTISAVDKISGFDGQFPRLLQGANSITLAYSVGTISQIQVVYQARYF